MRILLWGTGKTYQFIKGLIFQYEKKKKIEIVGLVNKSEEKEMDGHSVYSKDDIAKLVYDLILICAEADQAISIRKDIDSLGVDPEKVKSYSFFLKDEGIVVKDHDETVARQCTVLKEILAASDEEVQSYDWMYKKISEYGLYPFGAKIEESEINYSQWGVLQIIEEFTQYCNYISTLNIRTAIEVGVFKGRSSYLMCAILARKNPDLIYTCVDIYDNLDSFEEYHKVLPFLNKRIPTTSFDYKNEKFDFAFIDADHSYEGSMGDYRNVGYCAKVCTVFHDIYGMEYSNLNGGVPRTWKEVVEETKEQEHLIFSHYPNEWMGIGLVRWNR